MPSWMTDALKRPLGLSRVFEDAAADQWVLDQLGGGLRIAMIASGGCTAAALAASPKVSHLHLVDINPPQISLARLKLHLLRTADPDRRLALLGHAPMPAPQRAAALQEALKALDLPPDGLGPMEALSELGLDYAGRYEAVFAQLQFELRAHAGALKSLLQMRDPAAQLALAGPGTELGRALEEALSRVFDPAACDRMFSPRPIAHAPFAAHFLKNLWRMLGALPAAGNPYLAQALLGRFIDGSVYPWLSAPRPAHPMTLAWTATKMPDAFAAMGGEYDLVHLSNIVDWMTEENSRATLERAWQAARPGGMIIARQADSILDVQSLCPKWDWQTADGETLQARDRSFLYRIHIGRKS